MSVQRVQRGDQRSHQRRRQPVRVRSLDEADVGPLRGGEQGRERGGGGRAGVVVDTAAKTAPSRASPASAAPAAARPSSAPTAGSAPTAAPTAGVGPGVAPAGLSGEAPVQPRQPRGRHRRRELLVSLSRRRRLDQPRHHQLREPTSVFDPDDGQQTPHPLAERSDPWRTPGRTRVTSPGPARVRTRDLSDLRVQRVSSLLPVPVRRLRVYRSAKAGSAADGAATPFERRKRPRRRHQRRREHHADRTARSGRFGRACR